MGFSLVVVSTGSSPCGVHASYWLASLAEHGLFAPELQKPGSPALGHRLSRHEEAFSFSVLYNEPKPRKLRNLPQVTRQEGRSRNLRPSLFPKPVQYTATGSIRKDYQPHKSSAVSQMRQQWGPFQSPFSLSISRIVGWSIPPNSVPSL